MLETWLIPQLRDRGLLDVWLQHVGAPAHFALSVRDVLNGHFPGRWISRSSPTSPTPLQWPPLSPDLTIPDNSLWVIIKGRVAARRYNNEDLHRAVEDAFAQLLQKCSDVCHRGHGGASVCVSSIKVHIRIHLTCNQGLCNWFKSSYGSVLVGVRWILAHSVGRTLMSIAEQLVPAKPSGWPRTRWGKILTCDMAESGSEHPLKV